MKFLIFIALLVGLTYCGTNTRTNKNDKPYCIRNLERDRSWLISNPITGYGSDTSCLFPINSNGNLSGLSLKILKDKISLKYTYLNDCYLQIGDSKIENYYDGARYYFKLNNDTLLVLESVLDSSIKIDSTNIQYFRKYFDKQTEYDAIAYTIDVKKEINIYKQVLQESYTMSTYDVIEAIKIGYPRYSLIADSLLKIYKKVE